jgi:hypothetical protein
MAAQAQLSPYRSATARRHSLQRRIRRRPVNRHRLIPLALLFLMLPLSSAAAQDIRGMELCTAEKQMERRTGCLQANIELLQQMFVKLTRDTNQKITAANHEIAAAKAEIASLKAATGKLEGELKELKELKAKPAPAEKPQPPKP